MIARHSTTDVALAIGQDRMLPIGKEKIVLWQALADEAGVEDALLAFFEQVHDAPGLRGPPRCSDSRRESQAPERR
jgi:hypothetical protein